MKKLKFALAAATLLGVSGAGAAPTVSEPTLAVGSDGVIRIDYTLSGEDAVVTAEVTTNGVPIGAELQRGFVGDVDREMEVGAHTIWWCPRNFWPNQYIADGSLKVRLVAWSKANPPDYLAQSIHVKDLRFFYPTAESVPGGVTNRYYKTNMLLMRRIHATGVTHLEGVSEHDDFYSSSSKHLAHMVTLTNDYYIGVYEMTLTQFKMVYGGVDTQTAGLNWGSGSSQFTNEVVFAYPDSFVRPIDVVSWCRLRAGTSAGLANFCWPAKGHSVSPSNPIGLLRLATGLQFDLPTEAQWEFAARAGDASTVAENVAEMAWTSKNWEDDPMRVAYGGENQSHEVGLLKPNAFGLYDMNGNIAEWCLDAFPSTDVDPYQGDEVIEPIGSTSSDGLKSGANRPARGGSYASESWPGYAIRWRWGSTSYNAEAGYRCACPAVLP